MMLEDAELLRRYAADRSEEAFAELVRRHLDLVYGVALRQVGGDAHLAEDVSQVVFSALARKAHVLSDRATLGGWLYRTAQFTAVDVVRSERQRRRREQEVQTMEEIHQDPTTAWDTTKVRPILDRAIAELDETDRDAVVLRFLGERSFKEVGEKLRLTENAARMRVERALDKLHVALTRRGVTSTTAAIAAALAAPTGVASPLGLAASVTGTAMAAGAAVTGAGATALAITFMSTTKATVGIASIIALAAISTAIYQQNELANTRAIATSAQNEQTALYAKVRELEGRLALETRRAQSADEDIGQLLATLQKLQTPPATPPTSGNEKAPITQDLVDARFKRARELAKTGDPAAALAEFLWCFDEGMLRIPSYTAVRMSMLNEIVALGEKFPRAFQALRDRRDLARDRLLATAKDDDAAMTFASINRALKEESLTLALLDQLPPGNSQRQTLAGSAYELLISARRYTDALEVRSFGAMNSTFDMNVQERTPPLNTPALDAVLKRQRDYAISSTAKNIEVLAGAGDLPNARKLATRLLEFDNSAETRGLLQQHLIRAGHPEVLNAAP